MKQLTVFIIIWLLVIGCAGCSLSPTRVMSLEEIVLAYETSGFQVESGVYESKLDSGAIAYVQANHSEGDYIYFVLFENEQAASSYEKDLDHPLMKGLFSCIYSHPEWIRMKTYGCVVAEYGRTEFLKPIEELWNSK